MPPFSFWSQSEPVAMSVSELALEEFLIDLFATQPVSTLVPTLEFLPAWSVPSLQFIGLSGPTQYPSSLVSGGPFPCWFRPIPQLHLRFCPGPQIPWFHLILLKPGDPPRSFDSSAPPWFVVPSIPLVCQPSDSTGFLISPALSIITLTLAWTYIGGHWWWMRR